MPLFTTAPAPAALVASAATAAPSPPLPSAIFCLDLDNTLVGDVSYQVAEWDLLKALAPSRLKLFRANLKAQLQASALIRPGVKPFLAALHADRVAFFVYTASDPRWAAFFVPVVEEVLGVRFARPLLTRAHCVTPAATAPPHAAAAAAPSANAFATALHKSLARVRPLCIASLAKVYHRPRRDLLDLPLVLVDNSHHVLPPLERKRLLKASSYTYAYPTDPTRLLPDAVLRHGGGRVRDVAKVLRRYRLLPAVRSTKDLDLDDFRLLHAEALLHAYQQHAAAGVRAAAADAFWPRLTKLLLALPAATRYKDKGLAVVNQSLAPPPPRSHHDRGQF
jgi:hypothetical protein